MTKVFFTSRTSERLIDYIMVDENLMEVKVEYAYGDYSVKTEQQEDNAAEIIARYSKYCDVSIISEEVFMHQFMIAHREIFYKVFPQMKPIANETE